DRGRLVLVDEEQVVKGQRELRPAAPTSTAAPPTATSTAPTPTAPPTTPTTTRRWSVKVEGDRQPGKVAVLGAVGAEVVKGDRTVRLGRCRLEGEAAVALQRQ